VREVAWAGAVRLVGLDHWKAKALRFAVMVIPGRTTIFALSSGHPPAAIAVVRISGPRARFALETMIGKMPEPRKVALARVRDPASGETIDEALALWFPGPSSETGEDVAELQLHGGRAVVAAVIAALGKLEGLRLAEPGEFTRRAFENGRLDLTNVEGLADLIYAETEVQRRQAFRQLKGLLGDRAQAWRKRLIEALALVEARIDFSDEADVPADLVGPALTSAQMLRDEIDGVLAGAQRGERLRDGLVVAIAGPPNAGKSTLLNRIVRREAAIVSSIPGTTRDVIEVHLDLDGYPVTLLDTAGIRESNDPVEREGIARARARAAEADLVLWVVEFGAENGGIAIPNIEVVPGRQVWLVKNKIDLVPLESREIGNNESTYQFINRIRLSTMTGEGMNQLMNMISNYASSYFSGGEPETVTRERHRKALEEASSALGRACVEGPRGREDIIAEELRLASRALGRLTGEVDVEDILDVIFRDFCIGK
jgi:tRNA modification GTPase